MSLPHIQVRLDVHGEETGQLHDSEEKAKVKHHFTKLNSSQVSVPY